MEIGLKVERNFVDPFLTISLCKFTTQNRVGDFEGVSNNFTWECVC